MIEKIDKGGGRKGKKKKDSKYLWQELVINRITISVNVCCQVFFVVVVGQILTR